MTLQYNVRTTYPTRAQTMQLIAARGTRGENRPTGLHMDGPTCIPLFRPCVPRLFA